MVRLKRRPFPAAVGTISVLTAVLVLAGCAKGNDPAAEKPDSEDAVLYVGDEPVSEAEYRMLAEKYSNQIYMQYTTEQVNSADFWQTETDGTAPWELLDELVQEELQYNYTLKDLAVELSVEEDYTYQELMEDREQENADREETLGSEEGVVYGLTDFDEQTYYEYWYSNLETQVTNALVEKETSVTEEECRAYYDDNPDTFSYEDGVTVLYAEFPYTQDDSAESDVQAQRMKKAMESTDSLSELSEAFPDASLQKLDLNSLDTQEGMSGVYTYRWQTASQMQEGQIFGPYEDNGMLCIMKCTGRTGDGSLDFAAVKGQIERYLQAGQAQEIIADRMEDAQISPGSISPEEIIVSL
mgnify:FL=1